MNRFDMELFLYEKMFVKCMELIVVVFCCFNWKFVKEIKWVDD